MSLRARLTLALLLTLLPALAAVNAALFFSVRAALNTRFDDALHARARSIRDLVHLENGRDGEPPRVEVEFTASPPPHGTPTEFYQLWRLDSGQPAPVQGTFAGTLIPADLLPASATVEQWDIHAGSAPYRCTALRFDAQRDPDSQAEHAGEPPLPHTPVLLVVAADRKELDRTISLFGLGLLAATLVIAATAAIAVRIVLRRGLTPVDALASRVAAIGPKNLAARATDNHNPLPQELSPIATGIDALVDRLADALQRERRLAASAAHELRTPLAEVRAAAEVALLQDRTGNHYRQTLTTILADTAAVSEATDAVLRLARIRSGREQLQASPVSLTDATSPHWHKHLDSAVASGVTLTIDIPQDTSLAADPTLLALLLSNLIANAARHVPKSPSGQVTLAASPADRHQVQIQLTNTLPPNTAELPNSATPHAGLGLLIAREIAETHGATLHTHAEATTYTVTLLWPAPQSPQLSAAGRS
ncbi:MAG: histidine kinase dimerization/phospho-acceptor domain-containing protein [Phycisphaerales bacterium]